MLEALLRSRARFVVVGAHALAVHGVPRATGDLDVLVEPTAENARRVWDALTDFGAPLDALGVSPSDLELTGNVIQLGLPPRRIDLLTSVTAVSFEEVWNDRVEHAVGALNVPFMGRSTLVRNKRATGRTRDLADLEALESSS